MEPFRLIPLIYTSNQNRFNISSGGTVSFYGNLIANGGNVGIGTTLPTTALTIRKAIASAAYGQQASMIEFKSYFPGYDVETVKSAIYSGVSPTLSLNTQGGFLAFHVNNNGTMGEKLRIDKTGSVGIGNSNPSAFNTLSGNHLVIGDGSQSNNLTLYSSSASGGNGYGHVAFADTNTSGSTAQYAGLIQYFHGNNAMQFYTNSSIKMIITSGGNVGIGRTNPSSKLHLDGSNYNTASETQFTITDHGNNYNSGNTSCRIVMESRYWSGDDNVSTRSAITNIKDNGNGSSGSAMAFHTTNQGAGAYSEKMRISSGGDLGTRGYTASGSVSGTTYSTLNTEIIHSNGSGMKYLGKLVIRDGSRYLDIAINTTSNNIMYYFMVKGYLYNRGMYVGITSGYTYSGTIININNGTILQVGATKSIISYRGTNSSAGNYTGHLCLRFDSGGTGYSEGVLELYVGTHASVYQNAFQIYHYAQNNTSNPWFAQ